MTATLYLTALALHCITIPSLSSPPTHSPDSPPAPGLIVTTCLYTIVRRQVLLQQSSVPIGDFISSKLVISASTRVSVLYTALRHFFCL